jgi:hypothetical protein
MAIIKCDDELPPAGDPSGDGFVDGVAAESYVEQDEVSIGKTLLAVESDFFTDISLKSPLTRDAQAPFLTENRPPGISDQFRAEFGKFWVQDINDKESAMVFLNRSLGNQAAHEDWEGIFAPTVFELEEKGLEMPSSPSDGLLIGLSQYTQAYVATALESRWGNISEDIEASDIWTAYTQGIKAERGSFSRPTPLVPDGETFTDHAFQMNTPFSKKELEMFANISNAVSVADVESDYDFYSKAYEEGIASTTVPENALPHLYTEVQRGESETENVDKIEEGYFREWINTVLSNQDKMNEIAEDYENVAILDSVVGKENILDSENKTTSAFEILMAYANRENLFPMNVNIEVDTNNISYLMSEAEDVGMVDDIVRMLMSEEGNVEPVVMEPISQFKAEPVVIITEEVLQGSYDSVANSMAKLNQNKAVTAAMSDNFVTQVATFIADLINGDYFEDQAMDILNQVALINSNGGFMPVDMEEITAAIQGLTNLIDSNSLMNNVVQMASKMVKKP